MCKIRHLKKACFCLLFVFTFNLSIGVMALDNVWITDLDKITIDTTEKDSENSLDIINSTERKINSNDEPIFDPELRGISDSYEAKIIYASYEDTIPIVAIDDCINWVNRKGFEIIRFLQVLVQPLTIIVFIIASLFTLFGSIGKGSLAGRGMWGMLTSAVVYATVLYAPVILQTFVGWLAS